MQGPFILVGKRGLHENGWKKKQNLNHTWNKIDEVGWFGRTYIISGPCIRGMHSTWMQTFSNHESQPEQLKRYLVVKTRTRKESLGLESCEEMRGKILRTGEQKRWTTVQSLYSMPGWPSVQKGRTGNGWRIVQCMFWNRPDMPFFLARIGRLDILWSVNKRWLSIVDWVYSKTQSFAGDLEDSKSTSGEFSVSLEVEHSFPDVGCVRNKLQSLPVQLNLKFFLCMLVCAGMVCVPARDLRDLVLGSGYWSIAFFQKPTSTGRPVARRNPKETRQHQNEATHQPIWCWIIQCGSRYHSR